MKSSTVVASLVTAVATALAAGCTGAYQSDFSLVVVNRVANGIQVLANGNEIGQVTSGQQASFSLHLTESAPNVLANGVAPSLETSPHLSAVAWNRGGRGQQL